MSVYQQALLGMIEIDKDNDVLTFGTSGGNLTLTPTRNTFANVIDLVHHLDGLMGSNGEMYLTKTSPQVHEDDFMCTIVLDGASATGTMVDGTIKDILFETFTYSGSTITATSRPRYSWIARYRSNDGNWFAQESGSVFKGSTGVGGNLSGISYTVRQKRSFEWPFVLRENVYYGSGEIDELRSFESVVNKSISNYLKYEDSNNIDAKGIYYIHSIEDYIGSTSALSGTWGDGKPNGQTYVYCSAGIPNPSGQSEDRLDTYYECNIELTTNTAPDWDN